MKFYIDMSRYPAAEHLYSPARRIFVFQDSVYKFAETDRIAVCAEKMPAFFVGCFFWFDVKGLAFEIAGDALIRNRQGDRSLNIFFVKCQCQGL